MEELLQFLNSIHPLSEGLIAYLAIHLKTRTLHKKDYLLKAGHICHEVCFIESGLLRCNYQNREAEICAWFMKEGDVIFSIESFYQQKPGNEYIQALEETKLYFIEYSELMYVYQQFPEFNSIGRILTEKYYQLWAEQLYALRMKQAPERYKWLLEQHGQLILRVPAKYLASYLGITEVTLSTIKGNL